MEVNPYIGTSQIISQGSQRSMSHNSMGLHIYLANENILSDAVLRLEDGETFPVNRAILRRVAHISGSFSPQHYIPRRRPMSFYPQ
jgi:hypothetical protein